MIEEPLKDGMGVPLSEGRAEFLSHSRIFGVVDAEDVSPAVEDGEAYPPEMKRRDRWCVWAGTKIPRAPWETGHCFPASWGQDADSEPVATFWKATEYAGRGDEFDWPDEQDDRDLQLGYILPHEKPVRNQISIVDFDDVRDPETGEVTDEVASLIAQLNSYTEISQSGTGLHVFVYGEIESRGYGKLIEDLDEGGHIEVYDHSRVVAMTGRHVEGTPHTIRYGQDTLDEIIEEYTDDGMQDTTDYGAGAAKGAMEDVDVDDLSPYFSANVSAVATAISDGKNQSEFHGAHPKHGAESGEEWNHKSTNFRIASDDSCWHCFLHDTGGNALMLVAVMEGILDCRECEEGVLQELADEEYLKLCLTARDEYGFEGKPPYRALEALADEVGVPLDSASSRTLVREFYDDHFTADDF